MKQSDFLEKILAIKPDNFKNYSYQSLPESFTAHEKITINCNIHGEFKQKAYTHLAGAGCRLCGFEASSIKRRLTTSEFVEKSSIKFNKRFDYSKTDYVHSEGLLTIGCPIHGDIKITPDQHFRSKHGCQKCDYEIPRNKKSEVLIRRAQEVHNSFYDYSQARFRNVNDKAEIICPIHGSFYQAMYDHVARGTRCPGCALADNKHNNQKFIEKAMSIHGSTYDYSKVRYETNESMVTIICKKHGEFIQRAGSHTQGNGCLQCYRENVLLPFDEFLRKAREVHGRKYNYSKVVYKGNKIPVEIICPIHGSFLQKPNSHISSGNGCKICNQSKGERAVENTLLKYGIDFIREYRLIPHRLRCDFFIPSHNLFIEFNGLQHYKPIPHFGGEQEFSTLRRNDLKKKKIISERNGTLIVLTYLNLKDGELEQTLIKRLGKIIPNLKANPKID